MLTRVFTNVKQLRERVVGFGTSQAAASMYKQWAVILRGFLTSRFVRLSRGGGEWPPLKRRTGSILRDKGILLGALQPYVKGAGGVEYVGGTILTIGYGGAAIHSKRTTIADIASFHQAGNKNLPQRKIIVPPDEVTKVLLNKTADSALAKFINE